MSRLAPLERALIVDATLATYAFGAFLLQALAADAPAAHSHSDAALFSAHDEPALLAEAVAHVALCMALGARAATRRLACAVRALALGALVVDVGALGAHGVRARAEPRALVYAALSAALGASAAHVFRRAERWRTNEYGER